MAVGDRKQWAARLFRKIRTIGDVVDWGLCTGCGACFSACKRGGVQLVNLPEVGIRPKFIDPQCETCVDCLSVCPGYEVDGNAATGPNPHPTEAEIEFGKALEIWEGYATDPEIRYAGSSGGVLTALSLYCLEKEGFNFVLHSAADEEKPWTNKTVQSRSRNDLLARTGSRYAPASPCDGLRQIEESSGKCVLIGKPCDTAAVWKMKGLRPELEERLGLVMAFFCAGTPSEKGTLDMMESLGIARSDAHSVRYRGNGWPGKFTVINGSGGVQTLTYQESWGKLTGYRPMRCHLCPDGLGRIADIVCGDAWDKFGDNGDNGRSLIIVRTERGRDIVSGAVSAGYLTLHESNHHQVYSAQVGLLGRRREIFGRLLAMTILQTPVPKLTAFSLFRSWRHLSPGRQFRTLVGTLVRIVRRRQFRRNPLFRT